MSAKTGIAWTDATWNPIVGCTKVSQSCKNRYAKALHDMRHKAHLAGKAMAPQYAVPFETVQFMPERLDAPLRWRAPRRVFVNSVSDLFHEDVPDEFIEHVFAVMALAQRHQFQVLTKRPARMLEWFTARAGLEGRDEAVASDAAHRGKIVWDSRGSDYEKYMNRTAGSVADRRVWPGWPLPNVWLGVSVENQAAADQRIPLLLETPAAVRFLSCEPLLGAVDVSRWLDPTGFQCLDSCEDLRYLPIEHTDLLCDDAGEPLCPTCGERGSWTGFDHGIDWVIAGGESGKGARPMHPDWARSLRDQCVADGVPFFFKQWGEWAEVYDGDAEDPHGRRCNVVKTETPNGQWLNLAGGQGFHGDRVVRVDRIGKKRAGRLLDVRTWDEFPASEAAE